MKAHRESETKYCMPNSSVPRLLSFRTKENHWKLPILFGFKHLAWVCMDRKKIPSIQKNIHKGSVWLGEWVGGGINNWVLTSWGRESGMVKWKKERMPVGKTKEDKQRGMCIEWWCMPISSALNYGSEGVLSWPDLPGVPTSHILLSTNKCCLLHWLPALQW